MPGAGDAPLATFLPRGVESGRPEAPMHDPTVFWLPNAECAKAMTAHVGFADVETVSSGAGLVLRARSPHPARGKRPDEAKAPWS